MSKIELINDSSAEQQVDALVNAANRMLMSGGGICGVVFKKAGYLELINACKAYDIPLNDGEAVITPAFNIVNAKYIIHAVGPDFNCTPTAFEKLYSAYYNSLLVLKENNLHSIAFPLISSGIFGGNLSNPVKTSIEQCIKAYEKFTEEYKEYEINVKICAYTLDEMKEAEEVFKKYLEKKKLDNRYIEIKQYVDDLIKDIDNMKFYHHKIICLSSLIDSFVQNYFGYEEEKNKQHFCDFILKFKNDDEYTYLEKVDPISLIYELEENKIAIEGLSDACIYSPDSQELEDMRKSKKFDEINDKKLINLIDKHTYISLIYKCRSKLVHESNYIGIIGTETENQYNMPIYFDFGEHWKLVFPYVFLKELFISCINNYLLEQKEKCVDPFNNNFNRKSFLAFYEDKKKGK